MGGAAALPLIEEVGAAAPAALPSAPGTKVDVFNLLGTFWKQFAGNPAVQASILKTMELLTPQQQALYSEGKLQLRIYVLKRLTEIHKQVATDLQPQMADLIADVLGDIFGSTVSPAALKNSGGEGGAGTETPVFGNAVVDILFQSMVNSSTGQPTDGMTNMARLMHGALRTQMAAFMGDFVDLGIFKEAMPDAAKMHEAIEGAIGLNRMVAFAARGALAELVHVPTQRALREKFRSTVLSEAQAATLLNAQLISNNEYEETLAALGWPLHMYGPLAEYHSRQLSEDVLKLAFNSGAISETELVVRLRRQGFNESSVPLIISSWKKDVTDKPMAHLVTVAGEMFARREIDDAEFKRLLQLAGIKNQFVDEWIAVRTIERSRPNHLEETKAVEFYQEGIWTDVQLRDYYTQESYRPDHIDALMALNAKKKAVVDLREQKTASELPPAPVDAVRESTAKEAMRRGIIDEATFRSLLSALGIKDARQDSEVAVARVAAAEYARTTKQHQLAEQGVTISAGSAEDAYVHALVNDQTLHDYYLQRGFPEGEWPLYLTIAQSKRAAFLARVQKQRDAAAAAAAKAAQQAAKQ